jgi:alpha-glucosidase (family GH31 glycosyl hydrolase)
LKSRQNPYGEYDGALVGKVWPGKSVFVDFLSPNA